MGLPESPALCLAGLSGDRPGVLILDQLDAIRWTAGHSPEAWSVCRELINQTLNGKNNSIKVILSCRTFDLENDPMLKSLLQDDQKEWEKVEVKRVQPAAFDR